MRRLRRFLIVLAVIAVLFWMFVPQPGPAVAQGSVLVFDIGGTYIEAADPPLLARLLGDRSRTFVSVLSEPRKAER